MNSKRGPMDMTSESRSEPKKKKKTSLGPGHYNHTSFTDAFSKAGTKVRVHFFVCILKFL